MVGKGGRHLVEHVPGRPVLGEAGHRGQGARTVRGKGVPVVAVEVPAVPGRRAGGSHQHPVAAAHPAVEELHAQLGLVAGPGGKIVAGTEKVGVGAHLQGHAGLAAGSGQGRQHAPVPRFQHRHPGDAPTLARQGVGQGGLKGGVAAEAVVVQGHPGLAQRGGKVAHGRQEEGDAGLMAPDVAGFPVRLGHPDPIQGRVQVGEQGMGAVWGVGMELVAQDQAQGAAGRTGVSHRPLAPMPICGDGRRRCNT